MGGTRRDLIYRMTADPEGFKKGMREAGRDSNQFYKELRKLEQQQQAVDKVMTGSGVALMGFGAAVGVGLGLAAKAAIDWESAWAGVAKVVDGSPEQLAALEGELRGLATILPQTHAEIAGVAAAAGQLGIAREDITDFTRTMVAMGVSTDLASEDAAMGMARLMNIMQTAPDEVSNLGSAIVGLGNAGASTESEIMDMALRIAGAGHTVGMTEAQVLGFSSALASVGIEAEAGGSSISTAMIKMSEAVSEGGDTLETFAQVAGVTADEFAAKFRSDPAAAIDMFVQGLGRMQESGGDVFATLDSLGMSEIRLRDALLRLAGAGDLLTESLATGNDAWSENTALMEEAARRYGTTEAQMQIARNQLVDIGITLGEHLLPAINDFLLAGKGMFAWFQGLSEGTQSTIINLGVAATAIGLIGGAALIAAPKLAAMSAALGEMGRPGAAKALHGVARVITGGWGLAIGAAVAVFGAFIEQQAEAAGRVEEFKETLDEQTSAITDSTRVLAANELEQKGLLETAQDLGISLSTMVDALTGDPDAMNEVNDAIARRREELIELAGTSEGNLTAIDAERGAITDLEQGLGNLSGELETAQEKHKRTAEAAGLEAAAANEASGATQALATQLGITTDQAESATNAFDDLDEQVRALIDSAFALNGAERDVEAGIDAITEALEQNGATLDRNTEAGRENESAIEDQITAIAQLALATAEQTGSAEEANAVLDEQTEAIRQVMQAAGFTEEQIDDYIGVLDSVPSEIETVVETSGLSAAIRGAQSLGAAIHDIPSYKRVVIEYSQEGRNAPSGEQEFADGGYVGFASGGIAGFPHGGLFRGRGGPRDDANVIRVSNGEFIVNAAATARNRELLEAINSGSSTSAVSIGAEHRVAVSSRAAGSNPINVYLTSYSGNFRTAEVLDDLRLRGVV